MKVLIVGQLPKEVGGTYTTGVCNVVYELSKCSSPDVDLSIYATNISDEAAALIPCNTKYRGSKIRPMSLVLSLLKSPFTSVKRMWFYKIKTCANPLRYEMYRDNIQRIIIEEKPEIIHCMNLVQMAAIYYANRKYKIPTILTFHGINKDYPNEAKALVGKADYITGLTPETVNDIKALGYNMNRCFLVSNGTDTSKFYYSGDSRTELRKELNVDEETTTLLTVGSLQHRKGQFSFCKILKDMPADFKFLYLIIGSGPDLQPLQDYISDNKLQDKIKIIGYVANTDLYKYYSAADVYIHGSYAEGQALSEVEAYATDIKTAVNKDIVGTVVTDTTNRDDYFIFDYNDFIYSDFCKWASEHKSRRQTRRQYDWKEIFQQYLNIYKKILNK